ncbi:MAG TPA: tetratricopeptide repeat protein, partial [Pirellulaceae bacterium]|nr:tetratricopeptide repeat protein [Pirellulaceae bacterium]
GWECLARSQHGLGQYAECRNSMEYLRLLAEDEVALVMAVGRLRLELGDISTAIIDFSSIIERAGAGVDPALLARAQCYERMGSLPRAISDYSRYLGSQPGHVTSRLKRARLYARRGEQDAALEDIRFVLDLEPRCLEAWIELADIELKQGQLASSSSACEQALAIDNRNWRLCLIVGQVHHQLERYSEAHDHFSRAIDVARTADEKAESFFRRAETHIALQQWDQAIFDLERATVLRSHDVGAWLTLADVQMRRDEWEGAASGLLHAMQVTPTFSSQWRGLAQQIADGVIQQATRMLQRGHQETRIFRRRAHALYFLNRLTESLADCDTVLAADPQDDEIRIRRSMVLHQLGEFDAALKDLTRLLRRQPDQHYVRYLRARTLVQTDDFDAALSDLNKAIAMAPRVAKYHLLRGEVQRRRGKLFKAIRAFGRAHMIQPGDVRALRLRAEACLLAGYPAEAVADLSRAHEMEPNNPEYLTLRGQALLNLDQLDQAIDDFDDAVRLNSKNSKTYTGRAMALLHKGEHQEALLWLTKAVHRFADERDQAQLFLARGRVFSDMGRPSMAIADYSAVLKRMPSESQSAGQVRLLRAIAWIRDGQYYAAERDLKKVRKVLRNNALADQLLMWVRDRDLPMPNELEVNGKLKQLTRPPRVREGIAVNRDDDQWLVAAPYDMWILRDAGATEFGPVSKLTLDQWAEQGRIAQGMRLLRSDWSKWKKAEKIYPDLAE